MSHLSKFLIICSKFEYANKLPWNYEMLSNSAVIFEQDRKVNVMNFDKRKKLFQTIILGNSSIEQNNYLFPDKVSDLMKSRIHVAYYPHRNIRKWKGKVKNKMVYFTEMVAEKLNATLKYVETDYKGIGVDKEFNSRTIETIRKYRKNEKLDIFLNGYGHFGDFQTYEFEDWCWIVPLPPKVSIYEQILFLPLDKYCWIFLFSLTLVSSILWRFIEGPSMHWQFIFGIYAMFVGQYNKIKA